MNYYKQGDAAKADQIKAAFEKLGMSDLSGYNFGNGHALFYTYDCGGSKVIATVCVSLHTANIIKTHPNYKELELPVESNFKVGNWICPINGKKSKQVRVIEVRSLSYLTEDRFGILCPISFSAQHEWRLWTIRDAKDGDVLVNQNGEMPFVFKSCKSNHIYCHCAYTNHKDIFFEKFLDYGRELHWINLLHEQVQPATKEQRDLLFAKMKEAGYEWDADKKELRKIKPHYDISNFHAGMPVLVRDYDNSRWSYVQFSHYVGEECGFKFNACGIPYIQCIPFNEDTEHLLGTTYMPSEEFINW